MEYARFGPGFVCRVNADEDWRPVEIENIPADELRRMQQTAEAKRKAPSRGRSAAPSGSLKAS
jgi:hypothetical protein